MYKILTLFLSIYFVFSLNTDLSFISIPLEEQVFVEINKIRQENNLSELVYDEDLSKLAREKSVDLASCNEFSHTSKTYGSTRDLLLKYPHLWISGGENISKGGENSKDIVDAFLNSPDHKKNILNPDFNKSGIGCFVSQDGTIYLTELFVQSIF